MKTIPLLPICMLSIAAVLLLCFPGHSLAQDTRRDHRINDLSHLSQFTHHSLISGDQARKRLQTEQSQALDRLDAVSLRPAELVVEAKSGRVTQIDSVLKMRLHSDHQQRALDIARATLSVLEPSVSLDSLDTDSGAIVCPSAPGHNGSDAGGTVVLPHQIDDIPVLGSNITVNMRVPASRAANQRQTDALAVTVHNNLQPFTVLRSRLPRGINRDGLKLDDLIEDEKLRKQVLASAKPVYYPVPVSADKTLLVKASLVSWQDKRLETAIVTDGGLVIDRWVPGLQSSKGVQAHIDPRTELPDFVSYRDIGGLQVPAAPNSSPMELVYGYLEGNKSVFRMGQPRCQFGQMDVTEHPQLPDTTFVRVEQEIAGYRVFGAQLVFELSGNKVMTVQGHILPNADMRLIPEIGPEQAADLAAAIMTQAYKDKAWKSLNEYPTEALESELVIFPGRLVAGLGQSKLNRLAYHVVFEQVSYFIDALTGQQLYGYSNLHRANIVNDALAQSQFARPFYVTANIDGIPQAGIAANTDTPTAVAGLAASAGFFAAHGWNGQNGFGSNMVLNSNIVLAGGGCLNAIYTSFLKETLFCLGTAIGDVIPHEFTHGVIDFSSGLIYADESGALNESYADIFGNLVIPDTTPPTAGAWLVGEASALGAIRNMAAPAVNHFSGYLSRLDLGCSLLDPTGGTPAACDNGGVHTNSGITNLAHVLLSDGDLAGGAFPGVGRAKMRILAFDVMTNRLTPWSRMLDSALATRASCDMFRTNGGVDLTGAPVVQTDCDQVQQAFGQVGLDIDLVGDWEPQTAGFTGTIVRYAGETTDSGCAISDVALQMDTASGLLDANALGSPAGVPAINYFGLMTATIPTTTPPIGTTMKTHAITWTSIFGRTPMVSSSLTEAQPVGATDCTGGPNQVDRTSEIQQGNSLLGIIGFGTTATGNPTSAINALCVLNGTEIEILDNNDLVIDRHPTAAVYTEEFFSFMGLPVNHSMRATIVTPGVPGTVTAGPPASTNLAANVSWSVDPGFAHVRWRLVYLIGQPAGIACAP